MLGSKQARRKRRGEKTHRVASGLAIAAVATLGVWSVDNLFGRTGSSVVEDELSPASGARLSTVDGESVARALNAFENEYLRSKQKEHAALLALGTWHEFYVGTQSVGLGASEVEALLVKRVSRMFGLAEDIRVELDRLLQEEQAVVSKELVERHGAEQLYAVLDLPRDSRVAFVDKLSLEREAIRRRFDGRYLAVVGSGPMDVVDEHLRSLSLSLARNTGDRSVSIAGAGSIAFIDAVKDPRGSPRQGNSVPASQGL